MNPSKHLLFLASIFALSFAGFAPAQTIIRITGSSTLCAAANAAILNILQPSTATYGYTGTNLNTATQAIFSGTTVNSNIPVIIKTSWSGTVRGIFVLAQNDPVPDSAIGVTGGWLVNSTSRSASGTPNANPSNIDPPTTADVTFSDAFQSSSIYPKPALAGAGSHSGVVGVIPFEWVAGNFAPGTPPPTFNNVTRQFAQSALQSVAVLSQATGNTADSVLFIQVYGFDSDSGARVEEFAQTGFGITGNPVQYQPTIVNGTITSLDLWPAQTTDGQSYPQGNEGFSSGADQAAALNTPGMLTAAVAPGIMIGYLGISDAASVTNGTALKYQGIAYSQNAVEQGQYVLWAYEHIYYRSSYAAPGKTVVDQLANELHDVTANTTASGILLSSMQVGRQVDGGIITPGNPY
jgi:hypothetical protein